MVSPESELKASHRFEIRLKGAVRPPNGGRPTGQQANGPTGKRKRSFSGRWAGWPVWPVCQGERAGSALARL